MDEKILQAVVTALVGALSAIWAGRLGVRRALEQKKNEHAFERRLQWYERAVKAISEHGAAVNKVAIAAREGFNEEFQQRAIDEMIATQPPVAAIVKEVQMYATVDSARAVIEFGMASQPLRPTLKDPSDRSKGFEMDVGKMEQAAQAASIVAFKLSMEMRTYLGLEPLQPPSPSKWQRLIGRIK